jgi:ABC-type dipeptide/oligopeptide/nickel transport system ATPase subunit
MDRDWLPPDVSVFRLANGKIEEFHDSRDPVTLPHEVQALPGNKFTKRVFQDPGAYYVRVRAGHPEFKLRTRVYDLPPYDNPATAVRTAVDYIIAAGDSWFANTPRRGGTYDRVNPVHQETSLCVACHASHFSQRAQLYAIANGYPLVQRQQLHFLQERFANNPRPFYGFEDHGAVWARVISAPANVLSRMSVLGGMYEQYVSGLARPAWHQGIGEYLKLYYAGRTKLPPDETNGNTPLVSAHEVAWYAWKTTHDARLPEMIAQGEVKNMVDLCYQTLALADNVDAPANLFLGRELLSSWGTLDDIAMESEARKVMGRLNPNFRRFKEPVTALSGGQRQSVAIARAIHFNARILIMDEPTAALGPAETRMVADLVRQLRSEGIGIFMISHDLHDVFDLCDRLTVMKGGRVVGTVRTAEVTHDDVLGMIIAGKLPGAAQTPR